MLKAIRAEKARREAERERQRVAQHADAIRARCATLAGFVREAWPVLHPETAYVHGWHIDAICEHLEAVSQGRIGRLLINVPPGMMKSLLVSVFWPAWEWTARPGLQYLTTSYSEGYVKRDSRRMRDLVESEWYQSLWGDKVSLSRTAEISFENTARGFREGKAFASLTGGRGDRVIIDDPHSTETAESPVERENTIRVFRESVPTRLNDPKTSAIVIIMQRLHEGDVSGVTLALRLGYVHLMLPMEFEPERACITMVGGAEFFRDPRSYDGELLFEDRFPREVVDRDKSTMTAYAVAGQFQQRPSPREGGLFKRHWFEFVKAVPAGARRCRGWDLAASKKKEGQKKSAGPAFTAGVKLAEVNGVYYIENAVREQGSPGDVERLIKATADQDGKAVLISIPQDPGQAAKSQVLAFAKLLAGFDVRFSPETGAKEIRARPVSAQAEVGNVKIVKTGDAAKDAWITPFLEELALFPAGTFKDQTDALSRAFGQIVARPVHDASNLVGTFQTVR